jgi:hypothetical protein
MSKTPAVLFLFDVDNTPRIQPRTLSSPKSVIYSTATGQLS